MKSPIYFKDKRVLVMGLGLHGGGRAVAEYCVRQGAEVTVSDLRSAELLEPGLRDLRGLDIRYVLGRHDKEDFKQADIVLKNPAVPRNSPYLATAMEHGAMVESDISIFLSTLYALSLQQKASKIILIGITGTKGKSSTSSAIHHVLQQRGLSSYLGGNITVSPLLFLEDIHRNIDTGKNLYIILELSSFQIGDLRLLLESRLEYAAQIYWPDYAILTNIIPDHQDYYSSMEAYVADKAYLFSNMKDENPKLIGDAGEWQGEFMKSQGARAIKDYPPPVLPIDLPGKHQQSNLSTAIFLLKAMGLRTEQIRLGLAGFRGMKHRLQYVGTWAGGRVRIINDSAATIPEACLRGVETFEDVYLICGGADKGLELAPIVEAARQCRALYLLAGIASDKLIGILKKERLSFKGAFDDLGDLLREVHRDVHEGFEGVVLLSPGCASFGLFLNEFDRGRQFVSAVKKFPDFEF